MEEMGVRKYRAITTESKPWCDADRLWWVRTGGARDVSHTIRVVLADDHALVLEGLRSLLAGQPDFHVIATATDGERLLDAVRRFLPDVVVSDVRMPYMDGLTCLEHIRRENPETRVLLITAFDDAESLRSVVAAGPDGLLLKCDPPEQVVAAIRQVMAGQIVLPSAARAWLRPTVSTAPQIQLSARELDVLVLVAEGLSNGEITRRLHISTNTVKFHLQNIYQRLGVANRTEASRWYLSQRYQRGR
jgi:DNA-binding NarL/FixJ family response regulator